ncbi:MAG TPA: hypothetical protein VKB88_19375 [Bryobacteraceae bacterium]|nr:hypothetical protein [Bryobacteraceae bacterium]
MVERHSSSPLSLGMGRRLGSDYPLTPIPHKPIDNSAVTLLNGWGRVFPKHGR